MLKALKIFSLLKNTINQESLYEYNVININLKLNQVGSTNNKNLFKFIIMKYNTEFMQI